MVEKWFEKLQKWLNCGHMASINKWWINFLNRGKIDKCWIHFCKGAICPLFIQRFNCGDGSKCLID